MPDITFKGSYELLFRAGQAALCLHDDPRLRPTLGRDPQQFIVASAGDGPGVLQIRMRKAFPGEKASVLSVPLRSKEQARLLAGVGRLSFGAVTAAGVITWEGSALTPALYQLQPNRKERRELAPAYIKR